MPPQGESIAKPETLPLIILSIVCEYDIKEVHENQPFPSPSVNANKRKDITSIKFKIRCVFSYKTGRITHR